jgi:hypothetical protein
VNRRTYRRSTFAQRQDELPRFLAGLDDDQLHRFLAELAPEDPVLAAHARVDCTYPGCKL